MNEEKSMSMIVSPFEQSRSGSSDDYPEIKDIKKICIIPQEYDIFSELTASGREMDEEADTLVKLIDEIKQNNNSHLEKNITFKLLFDSTKTTLKEYKAQTILFNSYTKAYEGLCNEENVVKVLDILREILKERKGILNEIINNVIKIQKLTNERIKIDMSTDEEDLDELVDPDEI